MSSWIETEDFSIRSFGDGFPYDISVHILTFPDLFWAKHKGATFIPGDRVLKGFEYLSNEISLSLAFTNTASASGLDTWLLWITVSLDGREDIGQKPSVRPLKMELTNG